MSDSILGHFGALRAYYWSLCRNRQEAEDLVQETLLLGIEHADKYQAGTNMRAWLFTVMRNRFLSNCRKAARERTGADACVSERAVALPTQDWHMSTLELQRALQRLLLPYREAVILVGALGVSYIEAAEILGCDIGTIKSRVSRARTMLRDMLQPEL